MRAALDRHTAQCSFSRTFAPRLTPAGVTHETQRKHLSPVRPTPARLASRLAMARTQQTMRKGAGPKAYRGWARRERQTPERTTAAPPAEVNGPPSRLVPLIALLPGFCQTALRRGTVGEVPNPLARHFDGG
jgi:hypothetical protein